MDEALSTDAVAHALEEAGLSDLSRHAEMLASHLSMVYEANVRLNLTRVDPVDAPVLHVVDSLRGLDAMRRAADGPWADLGSGAGFPGIPLAICADRHVDLLESVGKKAAFLESVRAGLCLNTTVRGIRAEDAARACPSCYSAVSARAVGALAELVELASPLLRVGGALVAWKGALSEAELAHGESAAGVVGMRLEAVREYSLPGSDARRVLVIFERRGRPKVSLPRRPGQAKRDPLG